jgi:drug/metabolite transporter (DMT)-like permease
VRTIGRFLALVAGVAMMMSAFLPWLAGMKLYRLPLRFLFTGMPSGQLARLADQSSPFLRSAGFALVILGGLVVLGSLAGSRFLVWLGAIVGLAGGAMLYIQVLAAYDRVPGNQYGASIGQAGVLVALIAGFLIRRRSVDSKPVAPAAPTRPSGPIAGGPVAGGTS